MKRLLYTYTYNKQVIFRGSATRLIKFTNKESKKDALFYLRDLYKGGKLTVS